MKYYDVPSPAAYPWGPARKLYRLISAEPGSTRPYGRASLPVRRCGIELANQQLVLTSRGTGGEFQAIVMLRATVVGDVDVQIGFTMQTDIDAYPAIEGAVGISVAAGPFTYELVRYRRGVIGFHLREYEGQLPYSAKSGRLGITRTKMSYAALLLDRRALAGGAFRY